MNAGTSCQESKGPQTKNQNKSNTSSCAALENLIKSKSTFKSVNFGVWIQNVHQYYLCRWLLRDVQHFQNPCVSFICMFGTLSSVAIVLSSAGFFPYMIVHLCIMLLTDQSCPLLALGIRQPIKGLQWLGFLLYGIGAEDDFLNLSFWRHNFFYHAAQHVRSSSQPGTEPMPSALEAWELLTTEPPGKSLRA